MRSASLPTLSLVALFVACSNDSDPNGGHGTGPFVAEVLQNRSLDPSGRTLTVEFDAEVLAVDAENVLRYTIENRTILSATKRDGVFVDLEVNDVVVPGDFVLDVQGGIRDLSGNASAPVSDLEIASTDTTPPVTTEISGQALTGARNDQVTLTFDDDMVEADVEDETRWSLESPLGAPVDLAGAVVEYDADTRTATLNLNEGNLTTYSEVAAVCTGMRDIGGNPIVVTTFGSTAVSSVVTGDSEPASLVSAALGDATNTVVLIFDEPVRYAETEDLIGNMPTVGTRIEFVDANGIGQPTISASSSTTIMDGLGAMATFAVDPEVGDMLFVYGITDLAGNPLAPLTTPLVASAMDAPGLQPGGTTLTAVEGEGNDIVVVTFDRPMHPTGLLNDQNYGLLYGFFENMYGASASWNGTDQVTFVLDGEDNHDIQAGDDYLMAIANLTSAQGTRMSEVDSLDNITAAGDAAAPSVESVRLDPVTPNAVLVVFSEAIQASAVANAARFTISGRTTQSAERIAPRAARVVFTSQPATSETLVVAAAALTDLAGNQASGQVNATIGSADTTPPNVTALVGTSIAGDANDVIQVTFDEQIDPASALEPTNWTASAGSTDVDLDAARIRYASPTATVEITLAAGNHLLTGAALNVNPSGVLDLSGNTLSGPPGAVVVGGDATPPSAATGFVNYRIGAPGTTIEVTIDEELDESGEFLGNWSASNGATVSSVVKTTGSTYRIGLSLPLGASDTLSLANARDLAGNLAAGAIVIDPAE